MVIFKCMYAIYFQASNDTIKTEHTYFVLLRYINGFKLISQFIHFDHYQ